MSHLGSNQKVSYSSLILLIFLSLFPSSCSERTSSNESIKLEDLLREGAKLMGRKVFDTQEWVDYLLVHPQNKELANLDIKILTAVEQDIVKNLNESSSVLKTTVYLANCSMRKSISYFRLGLEEKAIESLNLSNNTIDRLYKYDLSDEVKSNKNRYHNSVIFNLLSDAIKSNGGYSYVITLLKQDIIPSEIVYHNINNFLVDNQHFYQSVELPLQILRNIKDNPRKISFWENSVEAILGSILINISWIAPPNLPKHRINEYIMRSDDPDDFISFSQKKNLITGKKYSQFNFEEDKAETFGAILSCQKNEDCIYFSILRERMEQVNIELILKYYYFLRFYYKWPNTCLEDTPIRKAVQIYLEECKNNKYPKELISPASMSILKGFLLAYEYIKENDCRILDPSK